jgi:hypothetical protein
VAAVEALDIPALGIVSQHPRYPDGDFDPTDPCRYFIRSRLFEERYSGLTERDCFNIVRSYCSWRKRGPIGKEEIILRDDRQEEHLFLFEAFHNGHELLTLITYLKPHAISLEDVARFAAVQDLFHQSLDPCGIPVRTQTRKYNYVVRSPKPQPGFLSVVDTEEKRKEPVSPPSLPESRL